MPSSHPTEVDRAKDAFLGILTHELRTPINVIMGYTSLVADGMAGPTTPEQREYLARALEGAEALLALVNDMLDMSRIEAGRLTIVPTTVDVAWIAEAAAGGIATAAASKRLALDLDLPADLPLARADEERVHQVLRILLSNAVKFTPEGGRIEVRATAIPSGVALAVRDTGLGIAEGDQALLFHRFAQLDQSTTRLQGGAGLGLALAKELLEAMDGSIAVESRPGHGSTFTISLRSA